MAPVIIRKPNCPMRFRRAPAVLAVGRQNARKTRPCLVGVGRKRPHNSPVGTARGRRLDSIATNVNTALVTWDLHLPLQRMFAELDISELDCDIPQELT
jgi:hypothetical protein